MTQKMTKRIFEIMKTIEQTTRACTTCGQVTEYEPIMIHDIDIRASMAFLCPGCVDEVDKQERAATRYRLKVKREAIWEKTVPARYRETTTTHEKFNTPLWSMIKDQDILQSMALIGPSGRCKTRVFALMAKRAIAQDITVGWCPANSFQWAAQREFSETDGQNAREWMRTWLTSQVLFLDDLGKHKWTDTVESAFFNLMETRLAQNLPTHWSMNPDPADLITEGSLASGAHGILSRALDPSGAASARARFAPIVSRLLDETRLIPVP
jgi:DNA replication protein DnaC